MISYEDFLNLEGDNQHIEWVDGEVIQMPPVSNDHQSASLFLLTLIELEYVDIKELGVIRYEPFQMKTGPNLPGRSPDVMFIARRNLGRLKRAHVEGPADVVVEVISPGSRVIDRGDKHHEYERGGVREYWLIDPQRKQAEFYLLGRDRIYQAADLADGIFRSSVLKGFWIKTSWLWQDPPPSTLAILRVMGVTMCRAQRRKRVVMASIKRGASWVYMKLKVLSTESYLKNLRLRMPFRFGITTFDRKCPHLFLRLLLEVDGKATWGVAADMLPNKWFTKDPSTTYAADIDDMLKIIQSACDLSVAVGSHEQVYDWWQHVYQGQQAWAGGWGYPPLLAGFGTSLVERAAIDAFCRHRRMPFSRVIRDNQLGIRLGRIHQELDGAQPRDLIPPESLRQLTIRHTVGMTDPLTDAEIADADRVVDGLPQSLEACIAEYGLTHFKIKLWGEAARDTERVRQIARIITANAGDFYAFTFDANENFKPSGAFRSFWDALTADSSLKDFLRRMICVEQPLHRAVALDDDARREFAGWNNRPPMIIDESDATLSSAATALDVGYSGTSHKNCKGIIKGIANAALLEHRRRADRGRTYILTGEDLTNIGPIALMQDLAVVANLGITHLERNGQHYFKGLAMFPADIQNAVLDEHPDLYRRHAEGFATLRIERGTLQVGSVVDRGCGANEEVDVTHFTPVKNWSYASLVGQSA